MKKTIRQIQDANTFASAIEDALLLLEHGFSGEKILSFDMNIVKIKECLAAFLLSPTPKEYLEWLLDRERNPLHAKAITPDYSITIRNTSFNDFIARVTKEKGIDCE